MKVERRKNGGKEREKEEIEKEMRPRMRRGFGPREASFVFKTVIRNPASIRHLENGRGL